MTGLILTTFLLTLLLDVSKSQVGLLQEMSPAADKKKPDEKATSQGTTKMKTTPTASTMRTHPPRPYKVERCDNLAYYCFKSYTTGHVCGKTVENHGHFNKYQNFKNICELDFMNCSEGFEVWTIAHMGSCMENKPYYYVNYMEYYEYMDDTFLNYNYALKE